ncbi:MAG: response regulator [Caulobacterales bacterium]
MQERRNALLVEDNTELADLVASYLEELGYYVKYCSNAKDALVALSLEDVNLLVSDIILGTAMDGFELAKAARTELPELPVLLITGYPSEATRSQETFAVLLKPFAFDDMQKAIAGL